MKKRTKMFCGGRSETTGAPAASVSPGKAITSATRPACGRGDRTLVESPLGFLQRRFERVDQRILRVDLARPAHRRLGGRQRRPGRRDLGFGRAQVGGLLIDGLLGRRARLQERRTAPQIFLRPVARRLGVLQVGLGLLDLAGLGRGKEVGELVARLLQEPARLIDRGPVVRRVLLEQRLALHDAVAARDMDGGQKALLGRADLDEIGLRVALPGDRRRSAGAEQRPGGGQHDRRDRRKDQDSTNHGDARFMGDARARRRDPPDVTPSAASIRRSRSPRRGPGSASASPDRRA